MKQDKKNGLAETEEQKLLKTWVDSEVDKDIKAFLEDFKSKI